MSWIMIQNIMMKFPTLVLPIFLIIYSVHSIDLILVSQQTCLDYEIQQIPSTKIFYFHYHHNTDSVKLVIYKKNSRMIMKDSGSGINYQNNLKVQYNETGNYTLCFVKKSESMAEISFEIMEDDREIGFAGKEQISKVSKRIGEALIGIKQIGFDFKQIIVMHNYRKQKIIERDNYYGKLLIIKILVMVAIVSIQIAAVKYIFK